MYTSGCLQTYLQHQWASNFPLTSPCRQWEPFQQRQTEADRVCKQRKQCGRHACFTGIRGSFLCEGELWTEPGFQKWIKKANKIWGEGGGGGVPEKHLVVTCDSYYFGWMFLRIATVFSSKPICPKLLHKKNQTGLMLENSLPKQFLHRKGLKVCLSN